MKIVESIPSNIRVNDYQELRQEEILEFMKSKSRYAELQTFGKSPALEREHYQKAVREVIGRVNGNCPAPRIAIFVRSGKVYAQWMEYKCKPHEMTRAQYLYAYYDVTLKTYDDDLSVYEKVDEDFIEWCEEFNALLKRGMRRKEHE